MATFIAVEKPKESFPAFSFEEELKREDEASLQPLYMVNLVVISASDVKNVDGMLDKSDPYCEVFIGDNSYKTETVQNDLNPVWDDRMTFVLNEKPEKVEFKVSDENVINKNVFIGSASLDLEGIEALYNKELPILENNGDEAGKIKFAIKCRTLKPLETEIKLQHVEKRLVLKTAFADAVATAYEQSEKLREEVHKLLAAKELEISEKSEELKKYEAELASMKQEISKHAADKLSLKGQILTQTASIEEKMKELSNAFTELSFAEKKATEAETTAKKEHDLYSAKCDELSKVEKEKQDTLVKLQSITSQKLKADTELSEQQSSTAELGKQLENVQRELERTKSVLESNEENSAKKYCCGLF